MRIHYASICLASLIAASALGADSRRPLLVTVDDLPFQGQVELGHREKINQELLAVLGKHRIPAVGLVVWGRVTTDADRRILSAWLDAGLELGSHSFRHPDFTKTKLEDYLSDVEKARVGLTELLSSRSKELRFFRFPFLNEGDTREKLLAMRAALSDHSIRNLPVTIDTQDWSFADSWSRARTGGDAQAMQRIAEEYQDAMRVSVRRHERRGDAMFDRATPQILLLHANAVGASQWDALFTWLEETHHRFASADEVLADPSFAERQEFVFPQGVSLWDRIDHEREWERVQQDVRKVLETQSSAWTRGDIEAFCSVYAEDALFVSQTGLTRGRDAVLHRYRARYPTAADMGRLSLDIEEIRPVWGPEVSMLGDSVPSSIHGVGVAARWTLRRSGDEEALTGFTLLVLRRFGSAWRIVQDASM